MKILITGAAGFIGSTLASSLLKRGDEVLGVDNLNDYYDVGLKLARLKLLQEHEKFDFEKLNIADSANFSSLFTNSIFDAVVNLAAQAGVRYSIENPHAYVDANLVGFINVLEACRHHNVGHLVYASSSSVYGANTKLPFSEKDNIDHPVSLYAASKKSNELMAHSYSHLYGIPTTALRFFTVYGPWGRPDMALFRFTKGILEGEAIPVFNKGNMIRDFTFVDDIVAGIVRVIDKPAKPNKDWSGHKPDPSSSLAPYRVYNIGNNKSVQLTDYIRVLESSLGKTAKLDLQPMQDGDVPATRADVTLLENDFDYKPSTSIETGISRFIEWYLDFYSEEGIAKRSIPQKDWYQNFEDTEVVGSKARDRSNLADRIFPKDLNGESVLDIGCAEGYFCNAAIKRGAGKVVGIDKKITRIGAAKSIQANSDEIEFRQCNFFDLQKNELGTFDNVLCLNVLHHIPDTLGMIDRLVHVTNKRLILEIADLAEAETLSTLGLWGRLFKLLPYRLQPKVIAIGGNRGVCMTPNALKTILTSFYPSVFKNIEIEKTYDSGKKSRFLILAQKIF